MKLPDFLTDDGTGEIRIVDHRIWLHHILRPYRNGHSVEDLAEQFPTLPLATIHRIIAFYLDNQNEIDAYLAAHDQDFDGLAAATPKGPSIAELRRRMEAMRRAQTP